MFHHFFGVIIENIEVDMAEAEGLAFHSMTKRMISRAGQPARREQVTDRVGRDRADVRLGVRLGGVHGVDILASEVWVR